MHPGGVQAGLDRRLFHALADPLSADVEGTGRPVPRPHRHQVGQGGRQVGWDRDLVAPLGFVPRYLRPEGDDRWVLAQPDVLGLEGQALPTRSPVLSMILMAMRTG